MTKTEIIRQKLREAYNSFVSLYGMMNKSRNRNLINKDVHGFLILSSLEKKVHNEYEPADVLYRSTKHIEDTFTTTNCSEALVYVLGKIGRVSIGQIAEITDKEEEDVINELGNLVYVDPSTNKWVTADAWLSGNVYQKLQTAKRVHAQRPEDRQIKRSLDAIQENQPEPIPFELIEYNLGERWVPHEYYRAFLAWFFDSNEIVFEYFPSVDEYQIDFRFGHWKNTRAYSEYVIRSKGNTTTYGHELMKHAMENTTPTYTYGSNGETKKDNDAIQLAADKIDNMRKKWQEWLYEICNEEEKQRLADLYNSLYNCFVLRQFDGSHQTFPRLDLSKLGKDKTPIELYPTQKDVVWRILQKNGGIVDWEVGGGKTLCMILASYEMKRLGIKNKPAILCLKANVAEVASTYRMAYPSARILAPDEKDFEPANRKRLFHEIKNNDWDSIILSHDQFGKIQQSIEIQKEVLSEEIEALEKDLEQARNSGYSISKKMSKGLENRKKTLEVKLKTAMDKIGKVKDEDITFRDMGIDHLVVDECFPYDTMVLTDQGWLKIGDIVAEKKEVNVVSYCEKSRIFELMPVSNWLKKSLVKQIVKITHEYGELICTEDHKIWTIEHGYVRAGQLTPEHTLTYTPMPNLWGKNKTEIAENYVLQQALFLPKEERRKPRKENDRQYSTLSVVWEECSSTQKEQVLQCNMQNGTSKPATTYQRAKAYIRKRVLGITGNRKEEPKTSRKDAYQQSYAQSRNSSQNGKKFTEQNILIKGRKWAVNRATKTIMSFLGSTRRKHGVGNLDQTCLGAIQVVTESLQSGYSNTRTNAVHRSRWKLSQNKEVEVSRQTKNRDIRSSRVVCVEIQERGSYGECGLSSTEDNYVYDLTVEKNHNYIADGVLVSNCHQFKNLTFTTRHDRVAGLGNQEGSQKALNMLFAIRELQKMAGDVDLQATFLSGTPISNSLTEMYLLFKYLRPNALKRQNITNFDSWAAVYAKKTTDYEFSVTNQIIAKERFRHFIKVPELALFYNEIADYKTKKMTGIDEPEMVEQLVPLTPTPDQQDYIQRLIKFAESGQGHYIFRDPLTDSEMSAKMLIATNCAKKMSTDMRLIDQFRYDDHPDSKLHVCATKVAEFYYRFMAQKGTQIIFCDVGTPNNDKVEIPQESSISSPLIGSMVFNSYSDEIVTTKRFNVYDAMRDKLVDEFGLKRDEIVFIHDYQTDKKKHELFKRVNSGEVRVLLGSTDKAGTGLNVQQRVVAMHHLDIPWKPSQLTQRNGRGVRPGNWLAKQAQDNKVYVFVYAVERSLDTYKFTLLKNKQTFISQMKNNELQTRSIDEGSIDESSGMNFAEYIAVLSGDNSLLEKAKADKKVALLENLRNVHYKEQHNNKHSLAAKVDRKVVVDQLVTELTRDVTMYQELLEKDPETGSKKNKLLLYGTVDTINKRNAAELRRQIEKQETKLLRSLKMKVPKKIEDEVEEGEETELKDVSQIQGEYLLDVFRNYRPAVGTYREKIGEIYGFDVWIERVEAGSSITDDYRYAAAQGSNVMSHNKVYAQHPEGTIKYHHNHGSIFHDNSKVAARNLLLAIDKSEGLLYNTYSKEQETLERDINHLSSLQYKPFDREEELQQLKDEVKRLSEQIKQSIEKPKEKEEPVEA